MIRLFPIGMQARTWYIGCLTVPVTLIPSRLQDVILTMSYQIVPVHMAIGFWNLVGMVSDVRRAANPTRKISITIPDRIFQELERTLSYSQSRSAYISSAIEAKLDGGSLPTITETSTVQLMAAILSRDDADEKLKDFILTFFS